MTRKVQSVLIGCVLLMLYRESSGYNVGDTCKYVEHAPHTSDCTKFYHCENDIYVEKDCPDDLHFNVEYLVCDWPVNANCQLTMETTEQTTTVEIPSEQTTAETTEWPTTTEKDVPITTTHTTTEIPQPSTSDITTEALTDTPEPYTNESTTTSESFTETTELTTSEFITESTDLTTTESITTTTPQITTIAEPFDEFGACLEYTTGSNYGYTDFMNISDIGRQRADYLELKVFVRTAKNSHIMLTADRSELGFEIVNTNNEAFMIKQMSSTIKGSKVNRKGLLNVNEYIPFIIRIFEKRIEVQVAGERKLLMQATVQSAIKVTLISFGTSDKTIGQWLYSCQVNPAPPTWSPNEPANSCERMPSGVFLRLSDLNSSPNNENIELKVYVATSAETVTVQLSSVDYSPSGSPFYEIAIGKIHQIWRNSGLIASRVGSIDLFQATQLLPILISVNLAGRIEVSVNNESKTVLGHTDPYAIDVQYVNFIAVGDIPSVWYHGDCQL